MVVPAPLVRKGMASEVTPRTRRWARDPRRPEARAWRGARCGVGDAQRVRGGAANAVRGAWRGQERGSDRPANKLFERAT